MAPWRIPVLASLATALLLAACGDGRDYPASFGDDDYDLAAMALRAADLPAGFEAQEIESPAFDNENWAIIFDTNDPEAKQAQLEAQGRLTNHVAAFAPEALGPVLALTNVSTLYTDAEAARQSLEKFACGLPINDSIQLEPFLVPHIADGATGFFVRQQNDGSTTFVDTTLCFRTGRILHAIQQTSIPGVEDIALSIRLANSMLERIDAEFADLGGG
ncbi:MAG: hypothetical protein IT295_13690 [Dehalococcoidia bacterium]|nr:hypothetical protein [Dehalococcoidia bacterium]